MPLPIPSLRTLLFRLHWALGLTAGLVLALMGLTGALMSYEEAVTAFANRDRLEVAPGERTALRPRRWRRGSTRRRAAASPTR